MKEVPSFEYDANGSFCVFSGNYSVCVYLYKVEFEWKGQYRSRNSDMCFISVGADIEHEEAGVD
jgi:hypothetical protein